MHFKYIILGISDICRSSVRRTLSLSKNYLLLTKERRFIIYNRYINCFVDGGERGDDWYIYICLYKDQLFCDAGKVGHEISDGNSVNYPILKCIGVFTP